MARRIHFLSGLLAVMLMGLAWTTESEAQDKKFVSPQAVFDTAMKSAGKRDWKTFLACMTPKAQDTMMVRTLVVGTGFRWLFAIQGDDEVAKKHGLTRENLAKLDEEFPPTVINKNPKEMAKAIKRFGGLVKDKAGYLADTVKFWDDVVKGKSMGIWVLSSVFIEGLPEKPFSDGRVPAPLENTRLKGVKINGNRATGKLVTKISDEELTNAITFVRSADGWKMEFPLPSKKPIGLPKRLK